MTNSNGSNERGNRWLITIGALATLITAIAGLLTSVGAPGFLPDIVKTILKPVPNQTPNSTPVASQPSPIPTPASVTTQPSTSPTQSTSSNDASQTQVNTASSQPKAVVPIETFEGFEFKFEACNRQAQGINCEFMVTNTREDRTLGLDASHARVFSKENGYVAKGKKIHLGTSEGIIVTELLPTNIPVKARITFEGIATDADILSAMTFRLWRIANNFIDAPIKFQSDKQTGIPISS